MIDTTINELKTTIGEIRDTINEGIQNRSDLTEDDKLKDDAPLVDYIDAITKLQSSITSTDQQIIVLYTYAKDKAAADSKHKPTISWAENENKDYNIEYGEFDPFGWVPTEPSRPQDITEKLWIRFASIIKGDTEATFGIPIQMTGDQGPKGDQGVPGTDAVILTGVHRLVKLYCESDTKPTVPAFRKDTSSNSKFKNDLDVTRIYYGDETNPTYIDEGDWTSEYTGGPNEVVWEIDVDINSKGNEVKILSTPIRKHITVTNTKVEYAANNSGVSAPTSGWVDSRPSMEDNSHLWSKTITTYSNGYTHEYTSLIQELPTVIKSITTTYLATQDTTPPDKNAEGWSSDIPMIGPVIWKKEVTEYTAKIGGKDSNIKTTITPVAIQGASGIKFIGTVTSESDLPTEALVWDEEYIGRMGMLVGADTYIWYGTSEPTPAIEGIKRIGSNYWLDMGPIHVCDWDAKEGELGYIKNRTHYVSKQYFSNNSPTIYPNNGKIVIFVGKGVVENVTIQFTNGQVNTITCGDNDIMCGDKRYLINLTKEGVISGDAGDIAFVTNVSGFFEQHYGSLNNFVSFQFTPSVSNSLMELLVRKLSSSLIPGAEYKFYYNSEWYVVKAISSYVLEMWCKSESKEIKVNWNKSVIATTYENKTVSHVISQLSGTIVNSSLKAIYNQKLGTTFYYKNERWYDDVFLTNEINYGITLEIITYRDLYGNEYQNPGCTFTSSSNNIVYGNGVVTCTNSNNNTIKMSSGSINITSSSNNIICGLGSSRTINIGSCNWCYILANTNCSNKSGAIINYTHNGSVVATDISVSGNIDVAGKVEAAGGFFKQ